MFSLKKLSSITLTALSLLFIGTTFAQSKKAKKANEPITTKQADTAKVKGFYSVRVYYSGNGLKYVKVSDYFGSDLNLLMKQIDSASNGAIVTIDDLRFIASNGQTTWIKEIPYSFNKSKDTIKFNSQAFQKVDNLKSYNFVSGTIYFSGFGYPNISSTKASDSATLHKNYDRSGPGTTITLDNCVYKNANGSLSSPLNKSMKLE
jgi:hypothetical protein